MKKLKLDIASYEKSLGIESKNQTKTKKVYLPPKEELRRMSMAEFTEWKRQQRIDGKKQAKKGDTRNSLETRLSTLQDMLFLKKEDKKTLSGDSAVSGPQSLKSGITEELSFTGMQGMLDDKDGNRV